MVTAPDPAHVQRCCLAKDSSADLASGLLTIRGDFAPPYRGMAEQRERWRRPTLIKIRADRLARRRIVSKRMMAAVVILILVLGGVVVSRTSTTPTAEAPQTAGGMMRADVSSEQADDGRSVQGAGSVAQSTGSAQDSSGLKDPVLAGPSGVPGAKQRLIKRADIELKIAEDSFQQRFARASSIAEQMGGFVTDSSTGRTKGRIASGTVTIRIPADKFQEALARLRSLGRVESESQSGQDVTKEFVDLEARLRHAKAQEAFFLRLMDQSKTVSELVQVQQQLATVQLEIEQLQGQINYLNDQTSFSSITARLFEPSAAGRPQPKGLGKSLKEAWAAFRTVIGGTIVFIGWVAPFAAIGAVGYIIFRLARRREARPVVES